MLRLTALVLIEAIIGLALAGAALAVGIPLMVRYTLVTPGDLMGSLVVIGIPTCTVGGMLFRPGSALNRYGRK